MSSLLGGNDSQIDLCEGLHCCNVDHGGLRGLVCGDPRNCLAKLICDG